MTDNSVPMFWFFDSNPSPLCIQQPSPLYYNHILNDRLLKESSFWRTHSITENKYFFFMFNLFLLLLHNPLTEKFSDEKQYIKGCPLHSYPHKNFQSSADLLFAIQRRVSPSKPFLFRNEQVRSYLHLHCLDRSGRV